LLVADTEGLATVIIDDEQREANAEHEENEDQSVHAVTISTLLLRYPSSDRRGRSSMIARRSASVYRDQFMISSMLR
jgi:hypothetical protein